ncbi:MAG: hypothetical protein K2V38_22970 [Gemmataceae bacterium]|nr:hypothetical protein [Gemmataceae bacterium]
MTELEFDVDALVPEHIRNGSLHTTAVQHLTEALKAAAETAAGRPRAGVIVDAVRRVVDVFQNYLATLQSLIRSPLAFDFGAGKLTPVVREAAMFVQMRELAAFIDADYDRAVARTRESPGFEDDLVPGDGGELLMPYRSVPGWLLMIGQELAGPDHRAAIYAMYSEVMNSTPIRDLTQKFLDELGVPTARLDELGDVELDDVGDEELSDEGGTDV